MNFSTRFIALKDYFLTQESFELWKDERTGLLKTVPQPAQLDTYYNSEDYLSHNSNDTSFFAKCYRAVKLINLKSKLALVKKNALAGNVLDVGAGTGELVRTLKNASFNAQGFEPSSDARAVALSNGIELLDAYPDVEGYYDIITMYHVLEHVPDVPAQIKKIETLLKPNGVLILALPNYASFDARLFKNYWAGYDVPRHLYHFTPQAVKTIFEDTFELLEKRPMWFDSFYVSILSARYKKWAVPFVTGGIVGFLSNCSALVTKEASSITYILQKRN